MKLHVFVAVELVFKVGIFKVGIFTFDFTSFEVDLLSKGLLFYLTVKLL